MDITFPSMDKHVRYPSRVILNNKTITIFTGDNYDSVYKAFDLEFADV